MFQKINASDSKIIIPAVAVIIFVFTVFFLKSKPVTNLLPIGTAPPAGSVEITGKLVCLPHRNQSGPQTMECAFGLQDTSGRYFALLDPDPESGLISEAPMDTPVTIFGNFSPAAGDIYPTVGTIEVTEIAVAEL